MTLKHWETAANSSRWLQKPAAASESFKTPAQATTYWKRWSKLASSAPVGPTASLQFSFSPPIFFLDSSSFFMYPPPLFIYWGLRKVDSVFFLGGGSQTYLGGEKKGA